MDLKSTLLVVGGSACCFKLLNTVIRFLPTPELARNKSWKWRNISTSLAHSSLTGAWAVVCFYIQPHMVEDLISSQSLLSHSLVAVSTGYFIHDFLDVALNQSFKRSREVLLHHSLNMYPKKAGNTQRLLHRGSIFGYILESLTVERWRRYNTPVLSCFSLSVTSRLYVGYAVVSLLVEINSVFLHIRQLLLLSGRRNMPGTDVKAPPRPSVTYSVTSALSLGTLLVFRVCTLAWMTRWLAAHTERVPRYALTMGTVGLSLISIMNVVLFYRLLRADVLPSTHNTSNGR